MYIYMYDVTVQITPVQMSITYCASSVVGDFLLPDVYACLSATLHSQESCGSFFTQLLVT